MIKSSSNAEILKNAFPSYLKNEIDEIVKKINFKQEIDSYIIRPFSIIINNEHLFIPERHCFYDIDSHETLTNLQREIIYCFYTRHCDGYIREQYLTKVILSNQKWVIPYVIRLLGEYVIEIMQVIFENLDKINMDNYIEFIQKNLAFYKLIEARVASYWDCYYRWLYKSKKDYVGFKILDHLDKNFHLKVR